MGGSLRQAPDFRAGRRARHRSEAAAGVARRGACGGLLPRRRGLRACLTATASPGPRRPVLPRSSPGISRCSRRRRSWLSVSDASTTGFAGVAAPLMEPGLCIAYRDNAGAFRQGICSGALADETAAPESFAALYRAIFRPGEPISVPLLVDGKRPGRGGRDLRRRHADRPELARGEPPALHHGFRAGGALPCGLCRAGARAAADPCHSAPD